MRCGSLIARCTVRNVATVAVFLSLLTVLNFWTDLSRLGRDLVAPLRSPTSGKFHAAPRIKSHIVSCVGPRGKRIAESPDDQIQTERLGPFATPFAGSFDALGLDDGWTTAEARYGPYGYDTDPTQHGGNPRAPVDWSAVKWGELQAQCQRDNRRRFPKRARAPFRASERRLRLRNAWDVANDPWLRTEARRKLTGKTLLVLRTFDGYNYTEEDKYNMRSLVSEAALQSGGEFSVMLFVNIRDSTEIFSSDEQYAQAFAKAGIPDEFRDLAMLWDDGLLQSWYPKIDEHRILFQINQSLQLLALLYPEFDHFWQFELDIRSFGNYTTMLRAMHNFATKEPRKQSFERASYMYFPSQTSSYAAFQRQVNASLNGGASIWGPFPIPEITQSIGPIPSESPEQDDFAWGVGEEADLVVTSPCIWVNRMPDWAFRPWYNGLESMGDETPRLSCPPAVQRSSRRLLLTAHAAQMEQGIALPSEATLPTFALWHGLKLSFPPLPYYQQTPPADMRMSEVFFNGGAPGEGLRLVQPLPQGADAAAALKLDVERWRIGNLSDHRPEAAEWRANATDPETIPMEDKPWRDWYRGFAAGEAATNQAPREHLVLGISWWFLSSFPRRILDVWTGGGFGEGLATHYAVGEQQRIDDARAQGDMMEANRLEALRRQDEEREASQLLRKHDGRWYAPPIWLHPVKTALKLKR